MVVDSPADEVKDPVIVVFPVIVGFAAGVRVNPPLVVIVPDPVFVNRPVNDPDTVRETLVTLPDPTEGFTQLRVVPFEARSWPDELRC